MKITINPDFTSSVVTDDGLLECFLPANNPETGVSFTSEAEALSFAETIGSNPNYFNKKLSDKEKAQAAELNFSTDKAAFPLKVKSEAGQLTAQVLKGLESEYELAEKEATSYKAAGYPATPIPGSVQSEINSKAAKGVTITATVACNNILTAATKWRNAQAELRDMRLKVTSSAEVASDATALDAIKAQWEAFMVALKLQLNV